MPRTPCGKYTLQIRYKCNVALRGLKNVPFLGGLRGRIRDYREIIILRGDWCGTSKNKKLQWNYSLLRTEKNSIT